MTILLRDIWPIAAPEQFTLHVARWNKEYQPLEVWVRNRAEWQEWQEYRPARDDFNRPYIFALAQFYHEQDVWLFCGVYRVLERHSDWRVPLSNVKGIYLISDVTTGKRYVGSAYGDGGIWSRWCEYVSTGHGGNVELRKLVTEPTLAYCRKAFRFALLEHRSKATADQTILDRETFWKKILFARGEYGLSRN